MMRVVYFGTPSFAVPTLEALAADERFDIRLVVSQPDRAAGRGRKLESSPVADAARALNLPLYQPASLRTAEARAPLMDAAADLFVVAAFGLIFGPSTLALPRLGCVNLHASLLPKYRGASPIQAAVLCGDDVTGVTLMEMEAGLDIGPMIASVREPIRPDDTSESLSVRLARQAADLALDTLPRYVSGAVRAAVQPSQGASITRLLTKADGWLDWTRPAVELERRVRAMWPWPRAWTTIDGQSLQIHRARVEPNLEKEHPPGSLINIDGRPLVVCGSGALALAVVQPAGRTPTDGPAFARGIRRTDSILGQGGNPGPQPPLVANLGQPDPAGRLPEGDCG